MISSDVPGFADVSGAQERLRGVAHRTPVITSRTLNALVGAHVYLKAENLQRTGTFKFRGAFNAIAALSSSERSRGIITFSSGNHAQAIALAGSLFEIPTFAVVPSDAPLSKVESVRRYGAEIIEYERRSADRHLLAASIAESRGLTLVPPYDAPDVIAGQGTAALELLDSVPQLDTVIAPVGGGGLLAGSGIVLAERRAEGRLVGVEPTAGNDVERSLETGGRISIEVPDTIADALQTTSPGELTFPILQDLSVEIVTVSDANLISAMRFAFERLKLVLEPSGAAALAALLSRAVEVTDRHVGVLLSGGNVDARRFASLVS